MTRPQVRLYWHFLNKRKYKELERQAIVMWGYDPKKKKRSGKQKEMAEKWLEDPLFGFPNDIVYLTKPEIEQKMGVSRRFGKRMRPEMRWDRERGEACIGRFGLIARRCSMNDKLWELYQKAKGQGVKLALGEVRKMILVDIKRSKLYPMGWTDSEANPPQWYLDQLRERGVLDQILKEIDDAARG